MSLARSIAQRAQTRLTTRERNLHVARRPFESERQTHACSFGDPTKPTRVVDREKDNSHSSMLRT